MHQVGFIIKKNIIFVFYCPKAASVCLVPGGEQEIKEQLQCCDNSSKQSHRDLAKNV